MRLRCPCGNTLIEQIGEHLYLSHKGRELLIRSGEIEAARCEECRKIVKPELPRSPEVTATWERGGEMPFVRLGKQRGVFQS